MFLTENNDIKWKRLFWGLVVTGIMVIIGMLGLDVPVYMWATRIGNWGIWDLMGRIFDAKVWLLVSAVVFAVYGIKRFVKTVYSIQNREIRLNIVDIFKETWNKTRTSHAFLIFASVFSACWVAWVLKVLIARLRPVFVMSGLMPDFNRFTWAWHSMPSGHTTVTFAGLVMIGMLAPRFKPLTWTLAIVVGLSRVCVGMHWPSDVILGAFIGMVVADFVKWAILKKLGKMV